MSNLIQRNRLLSYGTHHNHLSSFYLVLLNPVIYCLLQRDAARAHDEVQTVFIFCLRHRGGWSTTTHPAATTTSAAAPSPGRRERLVIILIVVIVTAPVSLGSPSTSAGSPRPTSTRATHAARWPATPWQGRGDRSGHRLGARRHRSLEVSIVPLATETYQNVNPRKSLVINETRKQWIKRCSLLTSGRLKLLVPKKTLSTCSSVSVVQIKENVKINTGQKTATRIARNKSCKTSHLSCRTSPH